MDFRDLFIELVKQLNSLKETEFFETRIIMKKLCDYLRVERIATTTYANTKLEALGRGDELVAFNSGRECVEALSDRIVNEMMNVITCRVYIAKGAEPWSDTEKEQIRLVIETISVYVSRSRIQAAADRFAFFDEDGYHNLRFFIRHIERTAQSTGLKGMAAIHFNFKHFSVVNQQIGRKAGSFVMHSFVESVGRIVGRDGIVCRMGGDNFVSFVKKEKLDVVLHYLSGSAIVYNVNSGDRIMISATAGVFVIPDDFVYTDAGDILDKIIASSTEARTNGKEDVVFYNEKMKASKDRMSMLQRIFPEAMAKEEFLVYYQPKIDITTGKLIGAEALCRWYHDGRLIPPMEFIPLLEQGLDICRLDFYMLDHVCRDIRRWLDNGWEAVRVSVNLSRKHMLDVDLLDHIMDVIDRNKIPHRYIEVELTETTTDIEFRDLKRVVSGLQQLGVSTSVDDFGMGYSSLNLIKEIPWDVLKIDKSFLPLDNDDEFSTRSVMFKYVVAMAKEMGLECIAEGVETLAQVKVLKNNNCELAQGFFFDKPLPAEEFEKRLRASRYILDNEGNVVAESVLQ
ncbi:MAG: GGDEF domain-containing protein [Ruminococcus sp.]|nr:GGDEF domain-containing protein [Ruminococcus sp.]